MRISEIVESLDRPWNLVTDNEETDKIKNIILGNGHGNGGLKVYHKENDPTQILFIIYHNGAWELHHLYKRNDDVYHSGERFKPKSKKGLGGDIPNTGFPATAFKLYKELLDMGQPIRVTAPKKNNINPITGKYEKTLWDAYEKFVRHIIAKSDGKYIAEPINHNGLSIQGNPEISQVIRPYGKKWIEEIFNKR